MIDRIKRYIPLKCKQNLIYLISSRKIDEYEKYRGKKKIIVTLAADYGNLGDIAITYAQTKYLKEKYPDYEVIELPISQHFTHLKALKAICTEEDIITTVGGGNMGDLYDEIEYCRQFVIKKFKNNKIISFPQTIDFSNSDKGNKALNKAVKIYGQHPNLTIVAREQISYEKMKEVFTNNRISLCPDIVMSLNEVEPKYKRENITLCLRDDNEKRVSKEQEKNLVDKIYKEFKNVIMYDTHIGGSRYSVEQREKELNKIWGIFKKSKVVVTDRLHGMIFCYITKTPCVVLQNNNHKVKGCYEWIKECRYIVLCENVDIDKIMNSIYQLYNIDLEDLQLIDLKKEFNI